MSKKSWKEEKIQQREAEILSVARRMFAQQGFRETNLNDVAKEVGIARGTIYLHFATKEDLLQAIVQNGEAHLLATMKDAIAGQDEPLSQLQAVLVEYLKIHKDYEDLIRILSPELKGLVTSRLYGQETVLPLRAFVQKIIEEGKAKGQFSREIDTRVAALGLFSIVTMQTYQDVVGAGLISHEELVNSVLKLYFSGLGGKTHG